MATTPENQEKEQAEPNQQGQNNNEEIAKSIPTVTPDEDNLEPKSNTEQEEKK